MTDDKQKQIEEMARDIKEVKHILYCVIPPFEKTNDDLIAERLYEQGYRKIPEGAVVLTREEYDRLKNKRLVCITPKPIKKDKEIMKMIEDLSNQFIIPTSDFDVKIEPIPTVDEIRKELAAEFYKLSEECGAGVLFWKKVKALCKEYGVEVDDGR